MRVIVLIWAAFCLYLSASRYLESIWNGFRDGYVSPFDRLTEGPFYILQIGCALQAVAMIIVVMRKKKGRPLPLLAGITTGALIVVLPLLILPDCASYRTCQAAYMYLMNDMIDDGAGG